MAKQTREVYPTAQIPHLFVHKAQESARNPQRNLFFNGDTIYSYGSHYPLARHIEFAGRGAILLNVRGYSSTTQSHISAVRQAARGVFPVFDTDNIDSGITGVKLRAKDNLSKALMDLNNAKSKPSKAKAYENYCRCYEEMNRVVSFLGDGFPDGFEVDRAYYSEILDEHTKKIEAKREVRREENRRIIAEYNKQWEEHQKMTPEERIAKWRAGGTMGYTLSNPNTPTMLRIKGNIVQTSRGAEFPLSHAVRALPIVKKMLDKDGVNHIITPGMIRLGHYTVDKIENGKLYAGCHVIEKAEIEHFAKLVSELRQTTNSNS